jgi:hypothetical protein
MATVKKSGSDKDTNPPVVPPADPWPGEGSLPRPPITDDKYEDAKNVLFRFKLQMEQVVGEVDRLLSSPYVGYLRQEAARLKVPIGGDGRHWPPLNQILAVLEAVKKRSLEG